MKRVVDSRHPELLTAFYREFGFVRVETAIDIVLFLGKSE